MAKLNCLALIALLLLPSLAAGQPETRLDLADVAPNDPGVFWIFGSTGSGDLGLPVAVGGDVDGDQLPDLAVAFMQASPLGRSLAGEVDLVFGNDQIQGFVDSAVEDDRLLRFYGDGDRETAGSEIWIDDVTGDGLADLLICRQNFRPDASRIGAGALTIVSGGAHLRQRAAGGGAVDLRTLDIPHTTLVGATALGRFGIWVRTGDLDGDHIADIIVGADQESGPGEEHRGAAWIVLGGPHLDGAGTVDLGFHGTSAFGGRTAKLTPPQGAIDYHFGGTTSIIDLDGNGRGEALVTATMNRGGAIITAAGAPPGSAHGSGGPPHGEVFIAWDDNFPESPWPSSGLQLALGSAPGTTSHLRGESGNVSFGEEMLGGFDFDGDQKIDLFFGDLAGDGTPQGSRMFSGIGWVLFDAATLRDREIDLDSPPSDLTYTRILGAEPGALGADTAAQGDFDGDGSFDLAFTSPHANPEGRTSAGAIHIAMGGQPWPETLDLAQIPPPETLRITEILGARATDGDDKGDTLGYSAAAGDLDRDGRSDLITNEMVGNGLDPGAIDVGNLIAISGDRLAPACVRSATQACLLDGRFAVRGQMKTFSSNPTLVYATQVMEFDGRAETDFAVFFESFHPGNFELSVKMVDGCGITVPPPQLGHWLFIGGLTNADTTVRIEDTARPGTEFLWQNPPGELVQSIARTPAFPCEELQPPSCTPDSHTACLQGRFRVTGSMRDFATPPTTFATRVMAFDGRAESDQAVFFDSFTRGNFEVGVKMVDACGLPPGHPQRGYWTFYGGLTNAETDIEVTDTWTGQIDRWRVEPGTLPRSLARTPAFPCDP